jgi:hypothetical protein
MPFTFSDIMQHASQNRPQSPTTSQHGSPSPEDDDLPESIPYREATAIPETPSVQRPASIQSSSTFAGQKRAHEDASQFALEFGHQKHLKEDAQRELSKFANISLFTLSWHLLSHEQLSPSCQSVWLAGQLLMQKELLQTIQSTNSVFEIPKDLMVSIFKQISSMLMSAAVRVIIPSIHALTKAKPGSKVSGGLNKYWEEVDVSL